MRDRFFKIESISKNWSNYGIVELVTPTVFKVNTDHYIIVMYRLWKWNKFLAQLNSTASPAPLRLMNNVISEAFLWAASKGKTIELAELAHSDLTARTEKFREGKLVDSNSHRGRNNIATGKFYDKYYILIYYASTDIWTLLYWMDAFKEILCGKFSFLSIWLKLITIIWMNQKYDC